MKVNVMEGAKEALMELKRQGHKIAMVTGRMSPQIEGPNGFAIAYSTGNS